VFLRRTNRASGRGARYSWPSLKPHEVRAIVADFKNAQVEAAAAADAEQADKPAAETMLSDPKLARLRAAVRDALEELDGIHSPAVIEARRLLEAALTETQERRSWPGSR
jgi:hypothetical protein